MNCTRKHAKRRKDEETNRAHVVSQDVPPVHKNLCQNGYVWVTMVIEHALFCLSLQSGPLVGLQRLTAVRGCGFGVGFLTKCPNYSINTPNVAKHPCMCDFHQRVIRSQGCLISHLPDSNSNFRPARINSELISGHIVKRC